MKYATIFALAAAAVVSARPTDDMSEVENVDLEAPVTAVPDPIPEATALSGPRPSENIDIHDVWIRKNTTEAGEKVITAVSFELDGDDAQNLPCHVSNPRFPDPKGADIGNCKDTKYSFTLHAGTDNTTDYSLRIYHETGLA